MNKFNEIFANTEGSTRKEMSQEQKDAFAVESKENRQKCYQLADEMAILVTEDSGYLKLFLDIQGDFSRYSVNNALLIAQQYPEASKIGDLRYWRDHNTFIKQEEFDNPILILEPGDEFRREDGSVGTYYNAKKVYDISQTKNNRHREHNNQFDINTLCMALASKAPVEFKPLVSAQMPEGYAVLYDDKSNKIYMSDSLDDGNIVFQLTSMEIAHAMIAKDNPQYDRENAHFNAYATSYLLCKQYGVPTENFEFDLPLQVENRDPQQIKKALGDIKSLADDISNLMEPTLDKSKAIKEKTFER